MNPFDIYNATALWGGCADMRPWLIVEALPNDLFNCFPIAGECYGRQGCFRLDPGHQDFPLTGLTKSCHVHHAALVAVHRNRFAKKRGELRGSLLEEFKFYAQL